MKRFWAFVDSHLKDDANRLRLKYHGKAADGLDIDLAITQIECRKRFGKKLAETLAEYPHWLFADALVGEQSTSDRLARYHATLAEAAISIVDLTAGLGIDVLHLSKSTPEVTAIELDKGRHQALEYNLSDTPVQVVHGDCRDYLGALPQGCTVFIDPARRADDGSRVYALSQCQPDVVAMIPELAKRASRVIIKMSPMLDITQVWREVPEAQTIISLGIETECKELIAVIDFTQPQEPRTVRAATLRNDGSIAELVYTPSAEPGGAIASRYGMPAVGDWIYDPYPSVMKAGVHNVLLQRYDVTKVAPNTHLYYSPEEIADFPGTRMKVIEVLPHASKHIKRFKKSYPSINVTTRNFGQSAEALRAHLGVRDGSDKHLFALTDAAGNKALVVGDSRV